MKKIRQFLSSFKRVAHERKSVPFVLPHSVCGIGTHYNIVYEPCHAHKPHSPPHGVKMLRRPLIFWLYTCKNIIADTNRQSNMHIIACGIICHQNWRIGPSLEAERVDSYSLKVKWILLINETILVNIVEFIHS